MSSVPVFPAGSVVIISRNKATVNEATPGSWLRRTSRAAFYAALTTQHGSFHFLSLTGVSKKPSREITCPLMSLAFLEIVNFDSFHLEAQIYAGGLGYVNHQYHQYVLNPYPNTANIVLTLFTHPCRLKSQVVLCNYLARPIFFL